jgi:excisionase family DNA binding protein
MDTPEYLLVDEAADLLRCPVATLYAWRHRNLGPPAKRVGKRLLYRRDDVINWIESQ